MPHGESVVISDGCNTQRLMRWGDKEEIMNRVPLSGEKVVTYSDRWQREVPPEAEIFFLTKIK